jgi:phosphate transport system substrate-binding protein
MKTHKGTVIQVSGGGSGTGIAALLNGSTDICEASRDMQPKEYQMASDKGIKPYRVAVALDGIAVFLNKSNPVSALTIAQLKDIYTGKITNWKELGGPDKPIVVISRETNSGTYECFTQFVLGKDKMLEKTEYVNSNPQAHARVSTTEGAIGYVGLGFVDEKVKALEMNGVAPTRKTVQSGKYPFSRPLYLFTNGYPELGSIVHAFCTFYLSEKGQEIIEAKGFVPVTNY